MVFTPVVLGYRQRLPLDDYPYFICTSRYIIGVRGFVQGLFDGDVIVSDDPRENDRICNFVGSDLEESIQARELSLIMEAWQLEDDERLPVTYKRHHQV